MIRHTLTCAAAVLVLAPLTMGHAGQLGVSVEFTDLEVSAIRAYYRDHETAAQPGNAKKGKGHKSLPPGIAKNLQRGKPLPPGIAKQALPTRLAQLLPTAPRGYERVIVSGKVLLVEIATQVVHDILEDVLLD
jgi:hypothetical protein